jgi:Fe2+ transport system protein B
MSVTLSLEVVVAIFASLLLLLGALLVIQFRNSRIIQKLTSPMYDKVRADAEAEAKEIVAAARAQAEEIVAGAGEEREAVVASYEQQIESLQAKFQDQLTHHTELLTKKINELLETQSKELTGASADMFEAIIHDHTKIRERFEKVLTTLERTQENVTDQSEHAVTSVKERLQETADTLAEQLQSYDQEISRTLSEHITNTYDKVDEQMAAYQRAREAILDRHILQIVEDVTRRVLRKQLTMSEHAELAREALAQAKRDNVL